MEWVFIDSSYAKAHQHSAAAASDRDEAIGKSRAGNTSKIHLAMDTHGLPIEFEITGGLINDCTQLGTHLDFQAPRGRNNCR